MSSWWKQLVLLKKDPHRWYRFNNSDYVEAEGFSVVQDFCGHGIGQTFHKEPNVLHYGEKGTGEKKSKAILL